MTATAWVVALIVVLALASVLALIEALNDWWTARIGRTSRVIDDTTQLLPAVTADEVDRRFEQVRRQLWP